MRALNENYIVRVYQRDDDDPNRVVGLVEDVSGGGREVFHTLDELVRILLRQSMVTIGMVVDFKSGGEG